jgi:hypothetical protein
MHRLMSSGSVASGLIAMDTDTAAIGINFVEARRWTPVRQIGDTRSSSIAWGAKE